jgi:cytochrome c-type protein NapC
VPQPPKSAPLETTPGSHSLAALLHSNARCVLVMFGFFLVGILFWGAFNWTLELTNTEVFCISCHEMRENVYREYTGTIHYTNPTGVRATCPDCHVPREWVHKVVRKVQATNELYHWLRGSIDTREKFLAKRLELARHVWRSMGETDSRECRNCHDIASMALENQSRMAARMHALAVDWDRTCIDCHKGIAHTLPEEAAPEIEAWLDGLHERLEAEGVPCGDCHEDLARPPADDDW